MWGRFLRLETFIPLQHESRLCNYTLLSSASFLLQSKARMRIIQMVDLPFHFVLSVAPPDFSEGASKPPGSVAPGGRSLWALPAVMPLLLAEGSKWEKLMPLLCSGGKDRDLLLVFVANRLPRPRYYILDANIWSTKWSPGGGKGRGQPASPRRAELAERVKMRQNVCSLTFFASQ